MRAVVTGGAGFIGSNLVDALLEGGHEVAIVDNLSTGRRENLDGALERGARLHEQDIRDRAALDRVVGADGGTDVIFHLAAQIDVRHSVADPGFDADVNVGGMIAVLEAARQARVGRVVYSSTGGAIYGDANVHPTPEDAPIQPLAPYGQSKYGGEGYCGLYERLHGVPSTVLRYANVYGPRQDPLGEGGVIAIFCGRAKAGRRPTVFGDGTQTRDYTYVGDVVAANLRAAEAGLSGTFNVGRGEETTVLELVDALAPYATGDWTPDFQPARPGEVHRSVLDPAHARQTLGWTAQTALGDGLQRTLAAV
jgi:UDP-glucose 4-epimerase